MTLTFKGGPETSDIEWAERVAGICGAHHETVLVDPETEVMPGLVAAVLDQMDEPHQSASRMISEYFLCEASRRAGINSTLTGAAPGDPVARIGRRIAADPSFESRDLETGLLEHFPGARYFSEERFNQVLTAPLDQLAWHQAALAHIDLLPGSDIVRALLTDHRLRSAASRITLFTQFAPPLLGVEERSPFLDTRLALLLLSVPPVFFGIHSGETSRPVFKECFRRLLPLDPDQRPDEPFPGSPRPAWLQSLLVPSLRPLVEDGILRAHYFEWLEKNVGQGRKRAIEEAWQLFVFNYWYQVHINRRDPLAPN